MAFDERLADRIRTALGRRKGLTEKRMFGGIGFLVALKQAHTRRFDLTGRPMNGWLLVEPAGLKSAAGLKKWVEVAAKYASTLPVK